MATTVDLQQILAERFGLQAFRPGQRDVIEWLLQGHSAAAVFPTGGGKSLCYQLPSLILEGLTLVVSPLTALMKDQIDALADRGIAAARLDSSLTVEAYREVISSLREGRLRLLYVSPERFNNERFRELLHQFEIALFAVDEAHCISEWGHNFRPDYLKLARYAEAYGAQRILALTATAPPNVLEDICQAFHIRSEHARCTDFYRANLRLLATGVTLKTRDTVLLERLQEEPAGATVVYVSRQKTAETVAELLQEHGYAARHYHAGLAAEQRVETQDWFAAQTDGIIVATIAFGMGIDKSDIRAIYHYNLPKSIENYAQEIGRAGRDGEPARCEAFLVADDLRTLENFVYGDLPECSAIHSMLADVFSRGNQFAVSLYRLSRQHDIRDLVLRTLLTYLELDGYLEGGTPCYTEYKFQPKYRSSEILEQFNGEQREFLRQLFRIVKPGRTWMTLDLQTSAAQLHTDRNRILRALEYLDERQFIFLKAAGVQHQYVVKKSPDLPTLAESLYNRACSRQDRELARLQALLQMLSLDGCLVSALGDYFGQPLPQPCGHCSWCETGHPAKVAEVPAPPIPEQVWRRLERLRQQSPDVFCHPRALVRFACGISSPLLVKEKLTRHELFGCLAEVPFATLLERAATPSGLSI